MYMQTSIPTTSRSSVDLPHPVGPGCEGLSPAEVHACIYADIGANRLTATVWTYQRHPLTLFHSQADVLEELLRVHACVCVRVCARTDVRV